MACASEKNAEIITPEHAVLIPPVSSATSILAYVEAVATVIGSTHIHSVYEDQDCIKVYLNDKKFVDFLVNTGISVLGRRVNVDYAIPRADKVTLKNVDPIIPDNILMRFLCFYGTPVSSLIHEKIASNLEYSHIECGTRKIYMNLFNDKKPPSKVSIQYQDVCYRFEMSVERFDKRVLEIDSSTTEDTNEEEIVDDAQEVESVVSLKPNVEELTPNGTKKKSPFRNPTPAQAAYRGRGKRKNLENSVTYAARRIKSRAAKGWYKAKDVSSTRGLVSKKMARGGGRGRGGNTRGRGRGSRGGLTTSTPISDVNMESTNGEDAENETTLIDQVQSVPNTPPTEKRTARNISQFPLSTDELKKLTFQTRCNRAPIHVAREFLARKNAPNAIEELLAQLMEYHDVIKVQSLRLRIRRLVSTLRSTMNDPPANP